MLQQTSTIFTGFFSIQDSKCFPSFHLRYSWRSNHWLFIMIIIVVVSFRSCSGWALHICPSIITFMKFIMNASFRNCPGWALQIFQYFFIFCQSLQVKALHSGCNKDKAMLFWSIVSSLRYLVLTFSIGPFYFSTQRWNLSLPFLPPNPPLSASPWFPSWLTLVSIYLAFRSLYRRCRRHIHGISINTTIAITIFKTVPEGGSRSEKAVAVAR